MKRLIAALLIACYPVSARPIKGGAAGPVNVCPAAAIAAGFTHAVFYETFHDLSKFDLTNAKTAGFSWYTGQFKWQGSTLNPTPSSMLSTTSDTLTISDNPNPGVGGYELGTETYLGSSAPRTVGTTFAPGGYYEWTFAFNPALQTSQGWPALWLQDECGTLAKGDNNSAACSTGANYTELDIFEAVPNGVGIDPTTNAFGWVNLSVAYSSPVPHPTFGAVTWTSFNTVGMLWKTRAENGGTGLVARYINGAHISDGDLTYGSTGDFSQSDSDNYILFLDTGPSWPLQVKSVLVCQ